MQKRITKIEESIFKDDKSTTTSLTRTDRSLNQLLSSNQNPLVTQQNAKSRSPVFGGWRERSISGPRLSQPEIQFCYIKNEENQPELDNNLSTKPTDVTQAEFSQALKNSRYDLKMIAQFEVERANRRVERAALQKPHEPKKQRQTYTVLD